MSQISTGAFIKKNIIIGCQPILIVYLVKCHSFACFSDFKTQFCHLVYNLFVSVTS